jgi:septum formation topological specificity factor MinE
LNYALIILALVTSIGYSQTYHSPFVHNLNTDIIDKVDTYIDIDSDTLTVTTGDATTKLILKDKRTQLVNDDVFTLYRCYSLADKLVMVMMLPTESVDKIEFILDTNELEPITYRYLID